MDTHFVIVVVVPDTDLHSIFNIDKVLREKIGFVSLSHLCTNSYYSHFLQDLVSHVSVSEHREEKSFNWLMVLMFLVTRFTRSMKYNSPNKI